MGHSAKLLNYAHLNIFYLRVSSRNMPNQSKRQSQLREVCEAKQAKLSSDDAETLEDDGINERVREWVSTLHRDDKMSLTLLLHVILVSKLNLELVEASELIGSMVGVSGRTVRGWRALLAEWQKWDF